MTACHVSTNCAKYPCYDTQVARKGGIVVLSQVIRTESDINIVLSKMRKFLSGHFIEVDQQKILVSVSELTRNVIDHANGQGFISWEYFQSGIRIVVSDTGGGITNLEEILSTDKPYLKSKGLGLGLSGTKRLMDDFSIQTSERGTKIVVVKYFSHSKSTR